MSSVVFPDIRSWGPVKKARMLFQNQYHRRIIRVIFFRKCHKERCPLCWRRQSWSRRSIWKDISIQYRWMFLTSFVRWASRCKDFPLQTPLREVFITQVALSWELESFCIGNDRATKAITFLLIPTKLRCLPGLLHVRQSIQLGKKGFINSFLWVNADFVVAVVSCDGEW